MKALLVAAAVCTLAGAFACAKGESRTEDEDTASKLVDEPTFQRAYEAISGIDYLPFDYLRDGCYARAFYMSMELATHEIPSNQVFAIAQPGHQLVVGQTKWGWHVAPMLEVGTDSRTAPQRVVDPSMAQHPFTKDEWVGAMREAPDTRDTKPRVFFVPGSDYGLNNAREDLSNINIDVPDFASLPAFKVSFVHRACRVMHKYIGMAAAQSAEAGAPDDDNLDAGGTGHPTEQGEAVSIKRTKLVQRTKELVDLLDEKHKLERDVDFDPSKCERGGD